MTDQGSHHQRKRTCSPPNNHQFPGQWLDPGPPCPLRAGSPPGQSQCRYYESCHNCYRLIRETAQPCPETLVPLTPAPAPSCHLPPLDSTIPLPIPESIQRLTQPSTLPGSAAGRNPSDEAERDIHLWVQQQATRNSLGAMSTQENNSIGHLILSKLLY